MARQITYGEESREALFRGIDSLANAVRVTLGPKGRNVILGKTFGAPTITKEGAVVVENVREMRDDAGFNAQTGQYENLVHAGIIDPTKVVRSALQNAASVASLLLTTEAVVSQLAS